MNTHNRGAAAEPIATFERAQDSFHYHCKFLNAKAKWVGMQMRGKLNIIREGNPICLQQQHNISRETCKREILLGKVVPPVKIIITKAQIWL